MILFGFVIVVIYIDPKLYFFYYDRFLMFLGLALFLLLLVQEFSVVHDAAYGRLCRGRNLYQIQVAFAGHFQRFVGRQDADLFAFVVNYADFSGTNALVDADKTLIDTILRILQG